MRLVELGGEGGNWNRCLEYATGEYVVILHADDCLRPRFLSRAAAIMEADSELVLVHSAVEHIGPDGAVIQLQQLYAADPCENRALLFKRLLLDGSVVNPPRVSVRRAADEAAGSVTGAIVWGGDAHTCLRM